jgi:hypothetical protein
MKILGWMLLAFSISTVSLDALGNESAMLTLLDRWGVEVGQIIRIGIGVCGIILLRLPKRPEQVKVERPPTQLRPHSENQADPMAELHNKPNS